MSEAATPAACATEDDCTHMPWCRIRKACQRAAPPPAHAKASLPEPVARVRLVSWDGADQIEWIGNPLPDGAPLYAAQQTPAPVTAVATPFDKVKQRIVSDPCFGRRLLQSAGIVGDDGKLSPLYQSEPLVPAPDDVPLPEPYAELAGAAASSLWFKPAVPPSTLTAGKLYTAAQLRAYGDARAAAERERCAKLCEDDAFVDQFRGLAEAVRRIRGT